MLVIGYKVNVLMLNSLTARGKMDKRKDYKIILNLILIVVLLIFLVKMVKQENEGV